MSFKAPVASSTVRLSASEERVMSVLIGGDTGYDRYKAARDGIDDLTRALGGADEIPLRA